MSKKTVYLVRRDDGYYYGGIRRHGIDDGDCDVDSPEWGEPFWTKDRKEAWEFDTWNEADDCEPFCDEYGGGKIKKARAR